MTRALLLIFSLLIAFSIAADSPPTTRPTTQPITQSPDGSILLHARDVTIHGKTVRYEPKPEKNTIGFWTNKDDYVSWDFQVKQPGTYALLALQGCGKNSGGAEVEFILTPKDKPDDAQTLTMTVQDTGGFQNFIERDLGHISLRPGTYTLTVKPKTKPGVAVMDLRQVLLKPVGATTKAAARVECELPADVQTMVFSANGRYLAIACEGPRIAVFDTSNAKISAMLKPDREESRILQFSPDSDTLFSYGVNRLFMATGGVNAWKWKQNKPIEQLHRDKWTQLYGATLSADGKKVWMCFGSAGFATSVDLTSGVATEYKQPPQFPPFALTAPINARQFAAIFDDAHGNPDGSHIAILSIPDSAILADYKIENGSLIKILNDGRILTIKSAEGKTRVVDIVAQKALFDLPKEFDSPQMEMSSDGSLFAIATTHAVQVFDLAHKAAVVFGKTFENEKIDQIAIDVVSRRLAIGLKNKVTVVPLDD